MVTRGDHSTARDAIKALLLVLIAVELIGFLSGRLWRQEIWYPVGLERFRYFAAVFVGIVTPVAILAPWALGVVAALVFAAGTIHATGWAAAFAPVLFLGSCWALGSLLWRKKKGAAGEQVLAVLMGAAVYVLLMTLTARLPVQYGWAWAILLAAPIVVKAGLAYARRSGPEVVRQRPIPFNAAETVCLVLLLFVLAMHWLVVLKPEAGADALAAHLAVGSNIAAHHQYTVDPARLVWAVMPMGADWTYSIVYVLGGEFAARLLNFAYLLMLLLLLYTVARRWLDRAAALLLVAVFAATPLVQLVTGELFVENFQALVILGMVVALGEGLLDAAAALAGTALAIKVGSIAFVAFAIPALMRGGRKAALRAGLLLLFAAPTYVIAWRLTGDPLYPYFTDAFHSSLLPSTADVREYRFHEALRWSTPYDLIFHTNRFYEGQDGSFGFQFLVLVPLAVVVCLIARRGRSFALIGAAGMMLILLSTPNARYLYPALPLLIAGAAAALGWLAERWALEYRAAVAYLALCLVANIWFLPSSSWYHKDFYLPKPFSLRWQGFHTTMVSPARDAVLHFRARHPGANVLLAGDNDQADLAADAHELGWHEPVLEDAIHRALDVQAMARLMRDWKIGYVVAPESRGGRWFRPAPLRELLTWCSQKEYHYLNYFVARLDGRCVDHPPGDRTAVTVRPGKYDDFDAAFRYRGDWDHRDDFDGPYLHSISYTDVPGAEAALSFEGTALTVVFTKAPNRGIAELWIDGVPRGNIDEYGSRVEWQARFRVAELGAGRHEAIVRASGRKQPAAQGRFVDVDAFVVE